MTEDQELLRLEKHLLFWICLSLISIGVALVILSRNMEEAYALEVKLAGTTLVQTGIIGVIFEYYFNHLTESRVLAALEEFKKDVKPEIIDMTTKLGIKKILPGRFEFDKIRLNLYDEAKEVSWLTYHAPNIPECDMVEEVLKRLKRGTNFRFLFPADAPDFEGGIRRLKKIIKENKGPGKVEIRIHPRELETRWYVHIIDGLVYAQPHIYDVDYAAVPIFICEERKHLYRYFLRHFDVIWDKSTPIEDFLEESIG